MQKFKVTVGAVFLSMTLTAVSQIPVMDTWGWEPVVSEDESGKEDMIYGWVRESDGWYFLNTVHDGTYGKALTGWQWIDGYCYYFSDTGLMLSDTTTPDGYQVNDQGAWVQDQEIQFIQGKGIITKQPEPTAPVRKPGGSAGSTGGGSGGSGRSSGGSGSGGSQESVKYSYSVSCIDIETGSSLHLTQGQALKNSTVSVDHPDIAGFTVCKDQKSQFLLTKNNQEIRIYYEKISEASPSDAQKVSWEVHFVEADNHNSRVFNSRSGTSKEGTELSMEFPEIIYQKGTVYRSQTESPYRVLLYGTGIQKYYIEYTKTTEEKPDPDAPAKEKLTRWLAVSAEADKAVTGKDSTDGQLITVTPEGSDGRLKNLVSMTDTVKRQEVYLIAAGHVPSSFIIGQTFPEVGSVSEMVMDQFIIEEIEYTVLKVGFEKSFEEKGCTHRLELTDRVPAGCLTGGSETVICEKCDYEVTVTVPAMGHGERDGEGRCPVCHRQITGDEEPEETYFFTGDLQARRIGDRVYLFRCIDEDYEDSLNNKQKVALFLCESVIRSDIDSTPEHLKTMSFGGNNNYKSSTVRSWLNRNASDSLFDTHKGYTGIALAYTGATGKGSFEQLEENDLKAKNKPFQLLEDNLFILSVEEALKYKDVLWRFDGSEENNPETQYSPYSKGYWLRTPQYNATGGQFAYGGGIYIVDMADGNIHSVDVENSSVGVRPAMTVKQGK